MLAESDLTWKKAVDVAQAMESAEEQANNFGGVPAAEQINALRSRPNNKKDVVRRERKSCFRFRGLNHEPQTCRFKNENCSFCQSRSHISRVCKKKASGEATKGSKTPHHKPVKLMPTLQYVD